MVNTITINNHGLNSGAKVILKDFVYDSDTIELNGRFFFVKVIDSNTVSLYTDRNLTQLQDLTGVSFDDNSQIVPVEFQATAVYDSPGGFTSDGRGILSRNEQTVTLAANTTNYTFDTSKLFSYIPGITDAILVVNSGVYVYATATNAPALTIGAFDAADTVKIINNGFIMGKGGDGLAASGAEGSVAGNPGGPALNLGYSISLTNNSYIAGGGGGGAITGGGSNGLGGGGAGGGNGAGTGPFYFGGAGGGPGQVGANGTSTSGNFPNYGGGGGGGRVLPGTGGAGGTFPNRPQGGGAGGGSTVGGYGGGSGTAGGSAGNPGADGGIYSIGGGGGWGARGGNTGGTRFVGGAAGGPGGKAINLNGYTVTYITTGTLYGAVS
jgi:hypothetical protein